MGQLSRLLALLLLAGCTRPVTRGDPAPVAAQRRDGGPLECPAGQRRCFAGVGREFCAERCEKLPAAQAP